MYAVVARSTIQDSEQARKVLREEGISRVSQAPGFVGANWVKLEGDQGTSMLVFESEEAARAVTEQLKTNPPGGGAVTINSIEVGEVVGRA